MTEKSCRQPIKTWNRDTEMQAVLEVFMKKSSDVEESDILVQLGFSRETEPVEYVYEEICYRNWLTRLWRPRSPTICCLQAGDPGKPACHSV